MRTNKVKYRRLKAQNMWTPQASSKFKEDEIAGLHADLKNIAAQVDDSYSSGGG